MDLVFEIGTEELPASFQKPAVEWLSNELQKELNVVDLPAAATQTFATPRRLAVIATGIPERSPDRTQRVKGPPSKAPEAARAGWAKKNGIDLSQAQDDGTNLYIDRAVAGSSAEAALPGILTKLVPAIPFRKSMRWGDESQAFARPVHWIGAALDGKLLKVHFADVSSSTQTRGHRFAANESFELPRANQYVARLREAHVLADWNERKARVLAEAERAAREAGGELLPDEELAETVTGLVEEPHGVYGRFEPAFLELPPEVLVSEMRGHLKYFAVRDAKTHKLLPAFVAISNTKVADPALSRDGYERAIGPRLADGKFFFDEDKKTKLSDRNPRLERIVFLQGLGSQWERVQRIAAIAGWLNEELHAADPAQLQQAAQFVKSDLTTGMVGEFPELQGVMGREYARGEGLPAAVADAIFEHYLPRGAEDRLPEGALGALLGLADRLDQLAGIFGIGKEPTGTADPYGLRRAAISLLRVVLHKKWKLDVHAAIGRAVQNFPSAKAGTAERVWHFLLGRLQNHFTEEHTTFEIQMALGRASGNLLDIQARLQALKKLRGSKELIEAAASFKRIQNILDQAREKDLPPMRFDAAALAEPAERELNATYEKARAQVGEALAVGNYGAAFELLAHLRDPLARFFDAVMVMAPDAKVRDNRLALLRQLYELFSPLADFSKLQA